MYCVSHYCALTNVCMLYMLIVCMCMYRYVQGIHAPGRCSDRSKCHHGDSATEGELPSHPIPIFLLTCITLPLYVLLYKAISLLIMYY